MRYIIALLIVMITTNAFAAQEAGSINLPNYWKLIKYNKDNSSEFSHCSIMNDWVPSTEYNKKRMRASVLHFALKVYKGKSMELLLGGSGWELNPATKYTIKTITSDGQSWVFDRVTAIDQSILSAIFTPQDGKWYSSMMSSDSVEFLINGQSIGQFTLGGSRIAFSELLNCWSSSLDTQKFDPSFGGNK